MQRPGSKRPTYSPRPISGNVRPVLTSRYPSVGEAGEQVDLDGGASSWTMTASGSVIGSRTRITRSSIRQNATTGAPVRSEPNVGNACASRPLAERRDGEEPGPP